VPQKLNKEVVIENSFTILWPWIIVGISILISILALGIGVWFSVEQKDWSLFSRAGSLLVIIALTMAIIDHSKWLKKVIDIGDRATSSEFKEELKKIFHEQITENLDKHNLIKPPVEIEFLADLECSKYLELAPQRVGINLRKWFQKYELIIAGIGTFVWGFGDLVGRLN
jgi:hypothetical protein